MCYNYQRIKDFPDVPELRMPDPNPFIPKNFTVHKKEVETVVFLSCHR